MKVNSYTKPNFINCYYFPAILPWPHWELGLSLGIVFYDLVSRLSKEGLGSRISYHSLTNMWMGDLTNSGWSHTINVGTAFDHLHHDNSQKSTFVFIWDIAYIFWKEKTKLKMAQLSNHWDTSHTYSIRVTCILHWTLKALLWYLQSSLNTNLLGLCYVWESFSYWY